MLKAEHPYLNTPPQKKRQNAISNYKDSVNILWSGENPAKRTNGANSYAEGKKTKRGREIEKKKKRRSEMESSLNASGSNFDVFAVAKRKQAKLERKAAAKKKEQQLQKTSDVAADTDEITDSESDSDDEWRKGWKEDIVYAQLLAEKHGDNFAVSNNEDIAAQDSRKKDASKEMFYFGNIGVLIKSDEDNTALGMPNENSVISLDNDENASNRSSKKGTIDGIDSLAGADFEPDSALQNGDEVESNNGSDEFSDEEPVDWRASEFPNEMFQDPLEGSDGKPKEVDPSLFMLGASISVKKAEKCGVDPLKFIARDSGKLAGLAKDHMDLDETGECDIFSSSSNIKSTSAQNRSLLWTLRVKVNRMMLSKVSCNHRTIYQLVQSLLKINSLLVVNIICLFIGGHPLISKNTQSTNCRCAVSRCKVLRSS